MFREMKKKNHSHPNLLPRRVRGRKSNLQGLLFLSADVPIILADLNS